MTLQVQHLFILLILVLTSCVTPDPSIDLSPQDKDLYITNRDRSVNFANYKTYAIVDSVIVVSKNANDTLNNKSKFSTQIISDINFELQNDGYVHVSKFQNPDVGINVTVLKFSDQVPAAYFAYASRSSGYYGYPSTAFWGYPTYQYGFPDYYGYYQIDIGSIAIEMIDLKYAAANSVNKKLNVIWSALIAGSISDSTTLTTTRIQQGINGSFDQSPYLKDGK